MANQMPIQVTGANVGGNITGENVIINVNSSFSSSSQVGTKHPSCFNVPTPTHYYRGREDTLENIRKFFADLPQQSDNYQERMIAIVGFGGMGKTETAYKLAAQYRETFSNVALIDAETPKSILESFQGLAKKLGIVFNQGISDVDFVQNVYHHIDQKCSESVLLIFDNAIRLNSVGAEFGILDYLPTRILLNRRYPNILITTQTHFWDKNMKTFEVGELSEQESLEFFRSNFKVEPTECEKEFKKLHQIMQGFPFVMDLAVSQIDYHPNKDSIAHLQQQLEKYIDNVTKEQNKLVSEKINPVGGNKYNRTISTVWKLASDRLSKEVFGSNALEILQIMSFCFPSIDTKRFEKILISDSEIPIPSKTKMQVQLKDWIRVLDKLHTVRILDAIQDDKEGYHCQVGIHRLIQLVVREQTDCTKVIEKVLKYLTHFRVEILNRNVFLDVSLLLTKLSQLSGLSFRALTYLGILAAQGNKDACTIFESREPETEAAATFRRLYDWNKRVVYFDERANQLLRQLVQLVNSAEMTSDCQFLADVTMKVLLLPRVFNGVKKWNCLDSIQEPLIEAILKDCSLDDLRIGLGGYFRREFDEKIAILTVQVSKDFIQGNEPKPQVAVERFAELWLAVLGKVKYYDTKFESSFQFWWIFWGQMYEQVTSPKACQDTIARLVECLWRGGIAEKLVQAFKIFGGACQWGNDIFLRCFEICLTGMQVEEERVQEVFSAFFEHVATVLSSEQNFKTDEELLYAACSAWIKLLLIDGAIHSQKLLKAWSRVAGLIWTDGLVKGNKKLEFNRYICRVFPAVYFTEYYPNFIQKYSSYKDVDIQGLVFYCQLMLKIN